jgi:hypothetical protein
MICGGWTERKPGTWICIRCGVATPESFFFKKPPIRKCQVTDACMYFGELLREARCESCHKNHGVYSCAIHGECVTSFKAAKEFKVCGKCKDFQPVTQEA